MHHFPRLSSLVKKHEKYKVFFEESLKRQVFCGSLKIEKANSNQPEQRDRDRNQLRSHSNDKVLNNAGRGEGSSSFSGKYVHWKKTFKRRFEIEDNLRSYKINDIVSKEDDVKSSLTDKWNFDLLSFNHGASSNFKNLDCVVCDESFATRRFLNEHKTLAHITPHGDNDKGLCYLPFFSEPKKFDETKLQLHARLFDCSLCQKWFGGVEIGDKTRKYLNVLKIKEKIKDENKKTERKSCKSMARKVCELCSKILSNRKGLERHMLIHTGEKPFSCEICGKPFRRKDNCVRHKKTAHLFKKPRKPRQKRIQIQQSPN